MPWAPIAPTWDELKPARATTAAHKLQVAVLERAVIDWRQWERDLQSLPHDKPHHLRAKRQALKEWLLERRERGVYSFVGICHCLGMDPDATRRAIFYGEARPRFRVGMSDPQRSGRLVGG